MTENKVEGSNVTKSALSPQKYSLNLGEQMSNLIDTAEKFKALGDNPVMFSNILFGITNAFDMFNRLLSDLIKKLEEIDERLTELESTAQRETVEITKKDQEVLDYVMTQEKVTAEEVQKQFDYSGKNAASARLHKLYAAGKLQKSHVGKTVYYTAPKGSPS
jgi:hypothetical protein